MYIRTRPDELSRRLPFVYNNKAPLQSAQARQYRLSSDFVFDWMSIHKKDGLAPLTSSKHIIIWDVLAEGQGKSVAHSSHMYEARRWGRDVICVQA